MAHIRTSLAKLWKPQTTHERINSQKMFVDNIDQQEANYLDLIRRVHVKLDSIDELKQLDVSTDDITEGTVVLVVGSGLYYYTTASVTADEENIVLPNTGAGKWISAGGTGGGNLVVDDTDFGSDIDKEQGDSVLIKIKKIFNKKKSEYFFPLTTTKAVRHTSSGKTLDAMLDDVVGYGDESGTTEQVTRDADTLGGKYKASDIDKTLTIVEDDDIETSEDTPRDADILGGKYKASDIDTIKSQLVLESDTSGVTVTTFNDDGSIKTLYSDGRYIVTTFPNTDSTICKEVLYGKDDKVIWTKTTVYDKNNSQIKEEMS